MWPRLAFLWCWAGVEGRGRAAGERGRRRRVRRPGCQRGGGGWRRGEIGIFMCRGLASAGTAWWARGPRSLGLRWLQWWACLVARTPALIIALRSVRSAAAGEEGVEEVKKPWSHTHTQIRDRKGRETALAPGYWFCSVTLAHFPLSDSRCSTFPLRLQRLSEQEEWPGVAGLSSWWLHPGIWSHFGSNPECLQRHTSTPAHLHTHQGDTSRCFSHWCAHAASPCLYLGSLGDLPKPPFLPQLLHQSCPAVKVEEFGGRAIQIVFLEKWCFFGGMATALHCHY